MRLRSRLTYANIVATLAVGIAVAGGPGAVAQPVAHAAASLTANVKKALKLGKRADKRANQALTAANSARAKADRALAAQGGFYTKAQSDARFLPQAGKATDADNLDGKDSSAFVQGTAAISIIDETITDPDGTGGAKGFSATVTAPGASFQAACLQQSSGIEMFLNKADSVTSLRLWRDDGGANPTVKTLTLDPVNPGSNSDSAPVAAADRVIWHGSSSAGTFTAVLFTSYEGGPTCHWSGYVIKSS